MKEKILDFLQKHNILNSGNTFLVGFSGGQDSLCLIDILHKISKKNNFKIIAAHLNHNWRGESSKKEQDFCEDFCKEKNIKFYTKTLDMSAKKTEESAREERYKFFSEIAKKTSSTGVFTAHTKTDNTETILYRIIKGTGIFGLCAIPEIRQEKDYAIFRPMLEITREETGQYCLKNGLTACVDESNFDEKYARNAIRLSIIPKLKKINPNLDDAVENLSQIAKDYEEILSGFLDKNPLASETFGDFSDAEKRACVHRFLVQNEIEYNHKKIDEIKDFITENIAKPCGNTLSLTTDRWLFVSKEKIEIISQIKSPQIDEVIGLKLNQDNYFKSLDKILTIKEFEGKIPDEFPKESSLKAFVNLPQNLTPLELRTKREGDFIQPFGMHGTMKLKKFFINKGVAEHKREQILLVASRNEILWAIGVGLSEKIKTIEKPTHIIELR